MSAERMRRIGRIGKPWGHRGEVSVHFDRAEASDLVAPGTVFVDFEGQQVPFFFTHCTEKGREVLMKFDWIDDPQAAAVLVGRDLLLPAAQATALAQDLDPEGLMGMRVLDDVHGELGTVIGLTGTDANPVLVIGAEGKEILVPLADEMILDLDPDTQLLRVHTPEGLVELYRNGTLD